MKEKKHRGGVRTPSIGKKLGRPKGEPTTTIAFRIPKVRKVEIFESVKAHISELLKQ